MSDSASKAGQALCDNETSGPRNIGAAFARPATIPHSNATLEPLKGVQLDTN
jgi:hypothetical protein